MRQQKFFVIGFVALLFWGCDALQGPAGEKGDRGPQGLDGSSVSFDEITGTLWASTSRHTYSTNPTRYYWEYIDSRFSTAKIIQVWLKASGSSVWAEAGNPNFPEAGVSVQGSFLRILEGISGNYPLTDYDYKIVLAR